MSLDARLSRLETAVKAARLLIVVVNPGETEDDALARWGLESNDQDTTIFLQRFGSPSDCAPLFIHTGVPR